jgi:hypothetical protein
MNNDKTKLRASLVKKLKYEARIGLKAKEIARVNSISVATVYNYCRAELKRLSIYKKKKEIMRWEKTNREPMEKQMKEGRPFAFGWKQIFWLIVLLGIGMDIFILLKYLGY